EGGCGRRRGEQGGGYGASGRERAAQVDRHHLVPLAGRQVEQRRDLVHAGRIDQHIGGTVQQLGGAGDRGSHGAGVPDIAGDRRGTNAGRGGQGVRTPVEQHRLRAL